MVRQILPRQTWKHFQDLRETIDLRRLRGAWLAARADLTPAPKAWGVAPRVLLVPSDPRDVSGSCGDEAMVKAVIHMADETFAGTTVDVLVWGEQGVAAALRLGMTPLDLWNRAKFVESIVAALRKGGYRAVVTMGADVIDGVYRAIDPAKQLVALDLAVHLGIRAAVLGASFSTKSDRRLKPYFDDLDPRVHFFLRDAVSLNRARAFTTARSELVADSAFMLPPAAPDTKTGTWIAKCRAEGKAIVGFNIHPMLLPAVTDNPESLLIEPAVDLLTRLSAARSVAWLLIPHDRRESAGDHVVLDPLLARLKPVLGDDIRMFGGFRAAEELKAIAGEMDGVVTGRMHLAIGSLGMNTPIMCVTYKDKFEGLIQHFGLPRDVLISLHEFGDRAVAEAKVGSFLDRLPALRASIAARKPAVRALSRRNFTVFDPVA